MSDSFRVFPVVEPALEDKFIIATRTRARTFNWYVREAIRGDAINRKKFKETGVAAKGKNGNPRFLPTVMEVVGKDQLNLRQALPEVFELPGMSKVGQFAVLEARNMLKVRGEMIGNKKYVTWPSVDETAFKQFGVSGRIVIRADKKTGVDLLKIQGFAPMEILRGDSYEIDKAKAGELRITSAVVVRESIDVGYRWKVELYFKWSQVDRNSSGVRSMDMGGEHYGFY